MKTLSLYALAGLSCVMFAVPSALAQKESPVAYLTLDQIYKEYQDNPMLLDKYKGKTIQVTGFVWSIGEGSRSVDPRFPDSPHTVLLKSATALNLAVPRLVCSVPYAEREKVAVLRRDMPVKATGVFFSYNLTFGGTLKPCTVEPAAAASVPAQPAPAKILEDPPLGEYAVYQTTNAYNFTYQYRFTLIDRNNYDMFGRKGTYAYNPGAKTLTFLTGDLKGFVGLYYTEGRSANGPTICLNPNGQVPNLEHSFRGQYQYAYYRPAGIK